MSEEAGCRLWEELTTRDVAESVDDRTVVIVPVAAIEQHGPHLPLSTDRVIGHGILEAACRTLEGEVSVFVTPMLSVGTSAEHDGFPGTLSLDPATLETTLFDIGASLVRSGVRRIVFSNSHGGNRSIIDLAGLRLRTAFDVLVVKAHSFRFPPPADVSFPDAEWTHGLHGGAVETSMMLHLAPDRVRSEEIRTFPSLGEELEGTLRVVAPEGVAPFAWTAEDLATTGVVGDASLADTSAGQRLVEHYGRCLADIILDARDFPLHRLATSP